MNLIQLAKDIETGNRPTKTVNLIQFFTQLSNGEYVPNPETRIQVRNRDRDTDFVERIVNKVQQTGDRSKLSTLTTVYFPKTEELKLLNGNHTVEIELKLGIHDAPAVTIDFEKDLGGKKSLLRRLGNLLNKEEVERNSTSCEDVKGELYELMDERISEGKCARPSDDEINDLISLYPFVSTRQIGQWISYHQTGGTRRPMKTYSNQELKEICKFYKKQLKYSEEYVVLEPRTLGAWSHTGIAEAFRQCMEEKKKKVLIPFYCGSVAEHNQLEDGKDKEIIKHYQELGEYWGLTMEADFLVSS
jgi:hypothetical protein